MNLKDYSLHFGTKSIQLKGIVKDEDPPAKAPPGAGKINEMSVIDSDPKAKQAYESINKDIYGGSELGNANIDKLEEALAPLMTVIETMCTELGRGFGFNFEQT